MFGNHEMDVQTARHIAANGSDRSQIAIILIFLTAALSTLGLHFYAGIDLKPAILIGAVFSAVLLTGYSIHKTRRRIKAEETLRRMQQEQLQAHRKESRHR